MRFKINKKLLNIKFKSNSYHKNYKVRIVLLVLCKLTLFFNQLGIFNIFPYFRLCI